MCGGRRRLGVGGRGEDAGIGRIHGGADRDRRKSDCDRAGQKRVERNHERAVEYPGTTNLIPLVIPVATSEDNSVRNQQEQDQLAEYARGRAADPNTQEQNTLFSDLQ